MSLKNLRSYFTHWCIEEGHIDDIIDLKRLRDLTNDNDEQFKLRVRRLVDSVSDAIFDEYLFNTLTTREQQHNFFVNKIKSVKYNLVICLDRIPLFGEHFNKLGDKINISSFYKSVYDISTIQIEIADLMYRLNLSYQRDPNIQFRVTCREHTVQFNGTTLKVHTGHSPVPLKFYDIYVETYNRIESVMSANSLCENAAILWKYFNSYDPNPSPLYKEAHDNIFDKLKKMDAHLSTPFYNIYHTDVTMYTLEKYSRYPEISKDLTRQVDNYFPQFCDDVFCLLWDKWEREIYI